MQVANINYDTKRVYLHSDTVTNGFDIILAYFEICLSRARNLNKEQNRKHLLLAEGNIFKGSGKFTASYGFSDTGWRFVPYGGVSHILRLLKEIVSIEGLSDRDVFDRSSLLVKVDIDAVYEPVETKIVYVNMADLGLVTLTQEEHSKVMSLPTANETAEAMLLVDNTCIEP